LEKDLKHFRFEFVEWKIQLSTEIRAISATLKEVVDNQQVQVSQEDDFVNLQKYEEEVKEEENMNEEEQHENNGTDVPMKDSDVEEKEGKEEEEKENKEDDKDKEDLNNDKENEKNDEDQPSSGGKCKEDDLQKKKI